MTEHACSVWQHATMYISRYTWGKAIGWWHSQSLYLSFSIYHLAINVHFFHVSSREIFTLWWLIVSNVLSHSWGYFFQFFNIKYLAYFFQKLRKTNWGIYDSKKNFKIKIPNVLIEEKKKIIGKNVVNPIINILIISMGMWTSCSIVLMYVVHGFGFCVHATCIFNSHENDKNHLQIILLCT
jgi:hypothetical protein